MSRERELRVLLDTSFILPTLGIDVGGNVLNRLRELIKANAEIFVSRFSILEALWVAVKLIKEGKFNEERFSIGLESILSSGRYRILDESEKVFSKALELYRMGHLDIIDNILYAASIENNMNFLSLDEELRGFVEKHGLKNTLIQ